MKKVVVGIVHYEKCGGGCIDHVASVGRTGKEVLEGLPQTGTSSSYNEDSMFPRKYMLAHAYEADDLKQKKDSFKETHPEAGTDFIEIEKVVFPTGNTAYFCNPDQRSKFCTAVYFLPVIGKKPAEEIRRGVYVYENLERWHIDTYKKGQGAEDEAPLDVYKTFEDIINGK